MKKQIDIQKTYKKKQLIISIERILEVLKRSDVTLFLEKETHFNNGESEMTLLIHLKDNFKN